MRLICAFILISLTAGISNGGLVAYWPLNEGTGQNVSDESGSGNDGVLGDSSAVESVDPTWGERFSDGNRPRMDRPRFHAAMD